MHDGTEKTLKQGWFFTSDMRRLDDEKHVFVEDWKKDIVIKWGLNICHQEVENAIFKHSAVFEVAVIGIPDDVWGESVKAFVELKLGMQTSEEEIIEICKQNLVSFKKRKSVEFVDAILKNISGKY